MVFKEGRYPLRRAHFIGTSVVITIDPIHVKRLEIDDSTFFIEKPAENGILLEMKKFQTEPIGESSQTVNQQAAGT